MSKLKLQKRMSFKSNSFKYGGYSALITIIVLAVLVVANLVVGQLNIKYDMSKDKIFTLSDQTYQVIDKLNQKVTIITFYKTGEENKNVMEILNKYSSHGKNIELKNVDPITNPQIAKKYSSEGSTVTEGSIVVESGSRFKAISQEDLVDTAYDYSTGQATSQSLVIEQKLTSALIFVVNGKQTSAYVLQGHEEQPLPAQVTTALNNQNFPTKELNLLTGTWSPKEGDMLIVSSPAKDLNSDELTKLKDYFSKGGRAVFLIDLIKNDMPNFAELMSTFGIKIDKSLVLEGDANHAVNNNPLYVLPTLTSHGIVSPITSAKLPVIMPGAQPIEEVKVKKASLKIEPLLTTSNKSWAKKNINDTSMEKQAGDTAGPFNLAVAVTDTAASGKDTDNAKIVVFSSSAFLDSRISAATNGGNLDLFINSVNWVQDQKDNIAITPKTISSDYLVITDAQRLILSALVVIVIPLIVIISGVVVWVRRRHL